MSAEYARPSPSPLASVSALIIIMLITFAAAATGASASVNSKSFYLGLARPEWAPPPGVFGPVWTVLYLMMAVAAWLVWTRLGSGRNTWTTHGLYLAQLVANALWSVFFFGEHNGLAAFINIVVLDVLVLSTTVAFFRVHRLAGLMFIPYAAWVLFATGLSWTVWRMNPAALG